MEQGHGAHSLAAGETQNGVLGIGLIHGKGLAGLAIKLGPIAVALSFASTRAWKGGKVA